MPLYTLTVKSRPGRVCYMDQAIPASLYLTWKYQDEFKAALQANAEVGGVNWHRGAVAGAIVGMLHPDAVDTLKLKLVSPRRR